MSTSIPGVKIKTKIKIENSSSKNFTVIELSSADKPGLLFKISSSLKKLGLTVRLVKISTRRGSVEDSFYVKKINGKKLLLKEDIKQVKESLKTILL